jgi:type I restriction enzyme S subunit
MSFPRYEEYKDSGVEWLGQIPCRWTVQSLKHVCQNRPSNVDKKSIEGQKPIKLCNYTDVYYHDAITSTMDLMAATATDDQIAKFELKSNDIIITKDSETADDIAIAAYVPNDLPGVICGYHLALIRPNEGVSGAFIKRLFDSNYIRSKVATLANGLTRVGLSHAAISGLELPVPPLDEQLAIASFLDGETAKIDALVAEQRRLVELLREKRQAVISHAVTKGLDPTVPMKPSGIPWLGDIPEHWETIILKRLVDTQRPITYGIVQPGQSDPTGSFMIRGGDYSNGWCDPDNVFRVSAEIEVPYARSRMKTGDLIITIVGAGVGSVAIVPDWLDGANITQTSARIALDPKKADTCFVCYALQGIVGEKNLDLYVYGSAQPRLNISHIDSYLMTVPPLNEQQLIAAVVREKIGKFDSLITEAERAILLLQERRTALISAAVTGKIDVRDFASTGVQT